MDSRSFADTGVCGGGGVVGCLQRLRVPPAWSQSQLRHDCTAGRPVRCCIYRSSILKAVQGRRRTFLSASLPFDRSGRALGEWGVGRHSRFRGWHRGHDGFSLAAGDRESACCCRNGIGAVVLGSRKTHRTKIDACRRPALVFRCFTRPRPGPRVNSSALHIS